MATRATKPDSQHILENKHSDEERNNDGYERAERQIEAQQRKKRHKNVEGPTHDE
jgi:hypothetical protein